MTAVSDLVLGHLGASLLLVPAVVLLALLSYRVVHALFLSPLKDIPGPFLARFTRLWELYYAGPLRADWHITILELHRKYGPIVRVSPNLYSFNSPEAMKKIYDAKAPFEKTDFYRATVHPADQSMMSAKGETEHTAGRRMFNGLYSMSTLVNYEDSVDLMNAVLDRKFEDFARRRHKLRVPSFMQCYALDVIGQITVDRAFGSMEAEGDANGYIRMANQYIIYFGSIGIVWQLHKPLVILTSFLGLPNPFQWFVEIAEEQLTKHRKQVLIEKENARSDPFITKLIKLETSGKVPKARIQEPLYANIGAGSDTTAITLSTALYHLHKDPSKLAALRKEIDTAAAEGRISNPITFAEAQTLPYLQAVIKEALRIHPPVCYGLPREVPAGGAEIDGIYFPGGTEVSVSAWALHQNPEFSGPNPDKFIPERHLGTEEDGNPIPQVAASFSFGGGTRGCIGKNISILEMTKVLPQIVRKYDLVFADEKPWELWTVWFCWQNYYCYIEPRKQ